MLQRYAHALFTQVSQSAACISSHEVDKRLSRWLMMTHDRAPGDKFEVKHAFMAMMLGVTRSVVTRAAGNLQRKKMIRYPRGHVTILDRSRLEATACECYAVVSAGYFMAGRGGEIKISTATCRALINVGGNPCIWMPNRARHPDA